LTGDEIDRMTPVMTTTTAPPSDTVSLTINGVKVTVKKGTLLVEAAKLAGIEIPVFCYHEKLRPVGACRMCLVEIEKMPRLQTACTTPVGQDMVVKTASEMAKGGQSAVISLLLANHPLDCPVCDKGGECPLQDNTFGYGPGVSRFEEEKRHNEKAFELSEKIVLDRERCILCYRCVRFHEEIPGDRALAVLDRGGFGEIGVLPGEKYDSPFQGNTIDICPVGALTSLQYRFRARPWDLKTAPSIAADDPTGANIDVDTRDGRVLRVRPRRALDVNDNWISDRTRFETIPVERTERLQSPLVRDASGKLQRTTWVDAVQKAARLLKTKAAVLVHPGTTNEAMAVLNEESFGPVAVMPRAAPWRVKGKMADIAKSKTIVVVGMDPWLEMPLLALWIRRAVAPSVSSMGVVPGIPLAANLQGAQLVVINDENGLFRDTLHWVKAPKSELRAKLQELLDGFNGKGALAGIAAGLDEKPATLIAGTAIASDPEARALLEKLAQKIGATGEGGMVGAPGLFANSRLRRATYGDIESVLVVGDIHVKDLGKAHGVWLTHSLRDENPDVPGFVDVVLPIAHPYEQAGSFTNLEGRVQAFEAAGVAPGKPGALAKADWHAVALIGNELGLHIPVDIRALREHLGVKHEMFKQIRAPKTTLRVVA
jgi:NADH-quinone oxidoreductase subunit G